MNTWHAIGAISPQDLTESRVQLHYAIQFIAATGAALAEALPDYSHTSLSWHPGLELFVGPLIRTEQPFRVALDAGALTLILLDHQDGPVAALPLSGKSMTEGLHWLKQEISHLGADASRVEFLSYPPDDFPDHALAHGARFDASQATALREVATYYANTYPLLQAIIATTEDASAIHIWPHHFDMATLITLPGMKNGNSLTVGVGLSPGDASYGEPYWYVSPYPYPAVEQLPNLEGQGFWHTQHWVGAVLTASQLPQSSNTQAQQLEVFLPFAVKAAIALLLANTSAPVKP